MERVKTGFCVFLICCLLLSGAIAGNTDSGKGKSILPPINEAFGISGPQIEKCISNTSMVTLVDPLTSKSGKGSYITEKDYLAIGQAFSTSGYILEKAELIDRTLAFSLSKQDKVVELHYLLDDFFMIPYYPEYYYEDPEAYNASQDGKSILPEPETLVGAFVPYIGNALNREATRRRKIDESTRTQEYFDFSEEDYAAVSTYLQEKGYQVKDYHKDGEALIINLEKQETTFTLEYDPSVKKATVFYPVSAFVEQWDRPAKTQDSSSSSSSSSSQSTSTAGPVKATSILDVKVIKDLISSCPSLTNITKDTVDYYSSQSDYYKDFPNRDAVHTWRITMQPGVVAFCDEFKMTVLTMVPNGSIDQIQPVLKWDISLYEAIPEIKRYANLNGVKLIIQKMDCKTGDYAAYADSNGTINLLDDVKRQGVLKTAKDNDSLLTSISAFSMLGDLDTNGNGKIDVEEIFETK